MIDPNRRRLVAVLGAAPFALSGCALLSSPEAPSVYRLAPPMPSPKTPLEAGIHVSMAPSPLIVDSQRIALSLTAEKVDVYAKAQWADRVPILVEQAVRENLRLSQGFARISGGASERGDWLLRLGVPAFEARYEGRSTNSPPQIVVVLNAALRDPERSSLRERRFAQDVRADSARLDDIVSAFNRAYGAAQSELIDWVYEAAAAASR
jgi:cholesterol transport system auxiliary component